MQRSTITTISILVTVLIGSAIAIYFLFMQNSPLQQSDTEYANTELGVRFTLPDGWRIREDASGAAPTIFVEGVPGPVGQRYQVIITHTLAGTGMAEVTARGVAEEARDRGASVTKVHIGRDEMYEGYRVDMVFGGDTNFENTYLNHQDFVLSIQRPSRLENENYPDAVEDYDTSEKILQTLVLQ